MRIYIRRFIMFLGLHIIIIGQGLTPFSSFHLVACTQIAWCKVDPIHQKAALPSYHIFLANAASLQPSFIKFASINLSSGKERFFGCWLWIKQNKRKAASRPNLQCTQCSRCIYSVYPISDKYPGCALPSHFFCQQTFSLNTMSYMFIRKFNFNVNRYTFQVT